MSLTTTPSAEGPAANEGPGTGHGAAADAPLCAHGISKRFGRPWKRRKWALDDVDLEIPQGSVTALVGPNGAGKTTLIRICMAFERPNAGHVEVAGVDPWRDRTRALKGVGYVPQSPAVYRGLSVDDHLAMARSLHGTFDVAYARRRLDQLGIPLDQRADTLSGGQAAQLGLAIALGTRASILLLDEPLANLDPLARREFIHVLLEAIRADGSTALLSSHIVTDVEEACDRLTILGAGKILLDSPLDDARNGHRLVEGDTAVPGATVVGSFAGRHGKRLTLWRLAAEGSRGASATAGDGAPGGQEPTDDVGSAGDVASLEDVVLGYLAAGRGNAGLQLD
jgi:ABC-2 type transport system ATP-binding protein